VSAAQAVDLVTAGPPLVTAVGAVALLLGGVLLPRGGRWALPGASVTVLAAALGCVSWQAWGTGASRSTFCLRGGACSYVAGDLALVLQGAMLLGSVVVVLLAAHTVEDSRLPGPEFFFLLLTSVTGALTLAAAGDLVTLLVALELVSLPAYGLIALRREDGRATEAALTFFLVSVVSATVTLYGISLVYGVTGSLHFEGVRAALAASSSHPLVASVGVVLTVAGFAFKVAAVPFHFWAPDVYVGAPLPVAAYLSVVSKAAGLVGLVLVLVEAFRPYADVWGPLLAVLAAVTMTVGNLVALRQRQAVRLLAWSSVAQSGYMLAPLGAAATAAGRDASLGRAVGATVVYLVVYVAMNLGAFSVVAAVGRHRPRNLVEDYRGLARSAPLAAAALALALACLAGLPPGLSGLFAKVVVFRAAVEGHVGWLAVVMAVNVVIGLSYYLAWAVVLFAAVPTPGSLDDGSVDGAVGVVRPLAAPAGVAAAVLVTAGATVALSVAPEIVFQVLPGVAAGVP